MKRLLLSMLLVPLLATGKVSYTTHTLINEQHKLNSAGRMGGQTRTYIPVRLPAFTTYVYCAISTYQKDVSVNMSKGINLAAQVEKILTGKAMTARDFAQGTQIISGTESQSVLDVFTVHDLAQAQNFVAKNDNRWQYDVEASRTNFSGGTIGINSNENDAGERVIYLCFRNPSALKAVYFSVEVVAVTQQL